MLNDNIQQIYSMIRINKGLFDVEDLHFYYSNSEVSKDEEKDIKDEEEDKYNKKKSQFIFQIAKPYNSTEYEILFKCNNYLEKFKILRYLFFLSNIEPLNRYFLNNYDFDYDDFDNFADYDIQYNTSCIYGTNFWFYDSVDAFRKICQEILDKLPDCSHYFDSVASTYPVFFINKYCYKCIEEKGKILNLNTYLGFLFPLLLKKFRCPPEIVMMIIRFLSPKDMVSEILRDLIYDSRVSRITYHY